MKALVGAVMVPLLFGVLGCAAPEDRARDGAASEQLDGAVEPTDTEDAEVEPAETVDAGCGDACTPAARGTDQLDDGVVGSACEDDADCGPGRCLFEERITRVPFPGGYCTGRCREDAQCGEHGYCAPGFRGAVGSCLLRCDTDSECARDGYRCRMAGDVGRCMPGPRPLPEGVVGDACTSDADCAGVAMACKAELIGVSAPGGYCSQSCSMDADCGPDGACVSGLGTAPVSIGTCLARCVPADGCREGYVCRALSLADDAQGLCVPERTDSAGG